MTKNKKILLSLPEELVGELDAFAVQDGVSRSNLIRTVLAAYVTEQKKAQLKNGYVQMGDINLSLAEMCFEADTAVWKACEEKLAECE
ncbi:MAG: ribbon-helix-helix protein, CopG family [Clostridia bacterium]|nr:ribbon-helix-helix protein, CopG family [Clostridia bacterium]